MAKSEISLIKNPFIFGSIVDGGEFCNRVVEMRDLKQYFFDGYSFWLFSPRRYGKSSLIKRIFENMPDTICVYIDLYNVKSIDDFARKYSNTLAQVTFDWKDEIKKLTANIAKYFKNLYPKVAFDEFGTPSFSLEKAEISVQMDIEQIINMPEIFAKDHQVKICVAFDEFQEIERIDPFIINWMRTAFQNHKNVTYAFLGSKQSLMESIFSDINSPFYEFAIKYDLPPISDEDLKVFIKDKFEKKQLQIEDDTIKDIIMKSGGHPHFTQYYASVVFDLLRNGEDQKSEDFSILWMRRILNSQGLIIQNIYDQLSTKQRITVSAVALSDNETELYSKESQVKYGLPASSTLTISIKALIKKDLVYKYKGKYKMVNPVFREWLIQLNTRSVY